MRAPLAACREPAGKLWQLCEVLYVFEHKTQYLLIKFVVIPPRFEYLWNIAIQPAASGLFVMS